MVLLLAVVLAVLAGLAALAVAAFLLGTRAGDWRTWVTSPPGAGALCLAAGGALLTVGGAYKMLRIVQAPAEQAESLTRLKLLLDEPLEQVRLRLWGPDPFQDRRAAAVLRLRLRLKSGGEMVSDVPRGRLRLVETEGEDCLYAVPWPAVTQACATPKARALADRFRQVGDFRRVEQFVVEIVQRGPRASPMPEVLVVAPNERLSTPLFHSETARTLPGRPKGADPWPAGPEVCGAALSGGPLGAALAVALVRLHADAPVWVTAFDDERSPAYRIATFWQGELLPPQAEFGTLFAAAAGAGGLLLAAAVGLLSGAVAWVPSAQNPVPPGPAATAHERPAQ